MKHSSRARRALARLPEVDPAIAALALWCTFRDGDGPTVTDGEVIVVGPAFSDLPISEQTGLIAHHVLHVALRHSARRSAANERFGSGFQAAQYDLACDALVNEALLQGGHALPRPAVRAADIVALLSKDDRPENVLAEWDCDQLYVAISAAEPSPDSEEGAIRQYAHAQGFEPDLKGSDPSKADVEVWSGRVEQALRQGQSAGSGIGAVLHQFGDLPRAVVPWEIKLRRLLAKALADQPRQSYRRPARGWLARDALARQTGRNSPVFEPGTVRQTDRPRLVIGIDTSSSIQRSTLEMFASEAVSMVRRTGAEAHLIGFDTEVHSLTRMQNADALKSLSMRREGGTSFGPALAKAQSLDPSLIVMLTDLDAPMPTAPKAPVLWSVPYAPRQAPGFGEVLVMSDTPEA